MTKEMRIVVYLMYAFVTLLALGWAWGVFANWSEIASRPVRLAYILCDFALVIPAGLLAARGLQTGKSWAFTLFPFALGALLFDTAHGVLYLLWDNYFGVPWIVAFALLAGLTVYTVLAMRTVHAAAQGTAVRVGS